MNKQSYLSYLKSQNADYIEELFWRYLADPNSVDESWRYFFEGVELGTDTEPPVKEQANGGNNGASGGTVTHIAGTPGVTASNGGLDGEAKVGELIQHYRELGILLAGVNPLQAAPKNHPLLELQAFELTEADLERKLDRKSVV